jgi:hypothetical protein
VKIDFTGADVNKLKWFGGANGGKISISYGGASYMLKFPPKATVNPTAGEVSVAPIFDCGSCLYPQIQEERMESVLQNRKEIDERLYVYPTSAVKESGKKINYSLFLMTTENEGCKKALRNIGGRIDMQKIDSVIDDTLYISNIYKRFLKTMISERKECIIDKSLARVNAG